MSRNHRYRRLLWLRWPRDPEQAGWRWDITWPLGRRIWWSSTDRRIHSTVPLFARVGRRRRHLAGVLVRQAWSWVSASYASNVAQAHVGWMHPATPGQAAAAVAVHAAVGLAAAAVAVWAAWTGAPSAIIRRLLGSDWWLVDDAVDGDTITCSRRGQTIKVRLLGIDTPEHGQLLWAEARDRTARLAGFGVRLIDLRRAADKYGRALAYVRADGADWGLTLIDAGLARARDYGQDHPLRTRYERAQQQAAFARRGLWKHDPTAAVTPVGGAPR